jgi:hypothetical protein
MAPRDPFAAVYAAPDDDQPRAALANRLAGKPRGELIALQLLPPTRANGARVKRLLAAHQDEWLASLGGALVKRSIKWERGFPVAGQLAAQRNAAGWDALIGLPALATLRRLVLELPNTVLDRDWIERFVFAPALRHLRVLSGLRRALLPAVLCARPPFALEELEIELEGGGGLQGEARERKEIAELQTAFASARGLPQLRALGLSFSHGYSGDPTNYAWLWKTALGRQLERLSLNVGAYAVAPWREALRAHKTALTRVVFFGRVHLVLERGDGAWDRLAVTPDAGLYAPELEALEATLAALRKAGVVVS